MKLDFDTDKAAKNIKAKVRSPENSGLWEAICEVKGCQSKADSSHLHDWSTKGWLICPLHTHLKEQKQ